MKIDLNKKMTLGTQRILKTFSDTLLHALTNKSFEEITVGELCENAMYPRATFYNYFDDKYDLFNYCVSLVFQKISIDDYQDIDEERRIYVFFERFFDLAQGHMDIIQPIFNNDINGVLFSYIAIQLNSVIQKFAANCERFNTCPLPSSMISQHYTNTIMLVIQYCIIQNNRLTKEQALYYLEYCLKHI